MHPVNNRTDTGSKEAHWRRTQLRMQVPTHAPQRTEMGLPAINSNRLVHSWTSKSMNEISQFINQSLSYWINQSIKSANGLMDESFSKQMNDLWRTKSVFINQSLSYWINQWIKSANGWMKHSVNKWMICEERTFTNRFLIYWISQSNKSANGWMNHSVNKWMICEERNLPVYQPISQLLNQSNQPMDEWIIQ